MHVLNALLIYWLSLCHNLWSVGALCSSRLMHAFLMFYLLRQCVLCTLRLSKDRQGLLFSHFVVVFLIDCACVFNFWVLFQCSCLTESIIQRDCPLCDWMNNSKTLSVVLRRTQNLIYVFDHQSCTYKFEKLGFLFCLVFVFWGGGEGGIFHIWSLVLSQSCF